jgi:hypothetical protein
MAARRRRSTSRALASPSPFTSPARSAGRAAGRLRQESRGKAASRSPGSIEWQRSAAPPGGSLPAGAPASRAADPASGRRGALEASAATASAHCQAGICSPAMRRTSSIAACQSSASRDVQGRRTRTRSVGLRRSLGLAHRREDGLDGPERAPSHRLEVGLLGLGRGETHDPPRDAPAQLARQHRAAQGREPFEGAQTRAHSRSVRAPTPRCSRA